MISSFDIAERQFRKTWRGLDPTEVSQYLNQLADEFRRLEERAQKLEAVANEYERARKSYDKIVKEAQDRAAQIIMDAESIAANILNDAQRRKQKVEEEITRLQHQRERQMHLIELLVRNGQQLLADLAQLEEFADESNDEVVE